MALHVGSLRLHDFRSYHEVEITDIGQLVVLVGPNAAGKTNLIEGIQLVTALDSFRNPKTEQLVSLGCEQGLVSAELRDGQRRVDVGVVLDARGRHYRLNGKQRPRQDLQGILPAVVFSPDDLQLVKGAPELRRTAMDVLGVQVSRNYHSVKRDYEKILRQKNRLLKDEVSVSYLESVNEVLVKIGSQLMSYRLRILRGLRELLPERHSAITANHDEVSLEYFPSFSSGIPLSDEDILAFEENRGEMETVLYDAIAAHASEEVARKMSLVGPHRDKPLFFLDGRPAADFASQGQQRSIAIAYKLAELQLVERITQVKPILLLDDVMSELDAARRATLTGYVREAAQTFITTTNLEYFTPDFLEHVQVWELPLETPGVYTR